MFGIKKSDEEYYNLSMQSFESGEYEKSLEYINIAISIKPLNGDYLFHKIKVLVEMEKYEEALKVLDTMENMYRNDPEIYSYKSLCYYSIEDYQNSIKYADLSIAIDHNNGTAYYIKAISLKKLRRFNEAEKLLETCLKLDITDSDAHSELARIYLDVGQEKKALSEAKLAIKYDKENEDAYDTLLSIFEFDDEPENYIETVIQAVANTGELKYMHKLNDFLKAWGLQKTGEEMYNGYIELNPDVPFFYDLLADILISEGRKDEAYSTYRKILKNGDIFTYKLWFDFLMENGEYEDAVEEIKRFGMEDEEILISLYFAYDGLEDYENALKNAEKILNVYKNEAGKFICAVQLNNMKKSDEALKYLDSYKSADDFEKTYEYFRSYLYKKDYEKAMGYIMVLLDLADEEGIVSVFCELVDNSDSDLVYKFLNFDHRKDFNQIFSLLKSIAKGVYTNYEDASKELKDSEYFDCEDLDLLKEDFNGKAKDFIEKYMDSECYDEYKEE